MNEALNLLDLFKVLILPEILRSFIETNIHSAQLQYKQQLGFCAYETQTKTP